MDSRVLGLLALLLLSACGKVGFPDGSVIGPNPLDGSQTFLLVNERTHCRLTRPASLLFSATDDVVTSTLKFEATQEDGTQGAMISFGYDYADGAERSGSIPLKVTREKMELNGISVSGNSPFVSVSVTFTVSGLFGSPEECHLNIVPSN